MIIDKKNFQGGKTKSIFENLIFPQIDLFAGKTYL